MCYAYGNGLYDDVPMNLEIKRLKENHGGHPQEVHPFHVHSLATPIIEKELQVVTRVMAKGKTPSSNGIMAEFFVKIRLIIGVDYHGMIIRSIEAKRFPKGFTKKVDNPIV